MDVSNQFLAVQEAEIYRFVIRTTDLKDPVPPYNHPIKREDPLLTLWALFIWTLILIG